MQLQNKPIKTPSTFPGAYVCSIASCLVPSGMPINLFHPPPLTPPLGTPHMPLTTTAIMTKHMPTMLVVLSREW